MSNNNNTSSNISVKLELESAHYNANDKQNLKFTLSNNSNQTLSVLKWGTPLEGIHDNLFSVRKQEQSSLYMGIIVKRGLPKPKDFIMLDPKSSISTNFNLDDVYDITDAGDYTVEFVSHILDVGEQEPITLAAKLSETGMVSSKPVSSNPVRFKLLEDRRPRLAKQGPHRGLVELEFSKQLEVAMVPAFSHCSNSQQNQIDNALTEAEKYANKSQQVLSSTLQSNRPQSRRYKEWFGVYLASRYDKLATHFDKIADAITNKKITFDCSCNAPDVDPDTTYAYVNPVQPYVIHLCNVFWQTSLTGPDSNAGTIIHELSHFYVVAGTTDTGNIYGQAGCRQLAINYPEKAILHADSHEYFAENNPTLTM